MPPPSERPSVRQILDGIVVGAAGSAAWDGCKAFARMCIDEGPKAAVTAAVAAGVPAAAGLALAVILIGPPLWKRAKGRGDDGADDEAIKNGAQQILDALDEQGEAQMERLTLLAEQNTALWQSIAELKQDATPDRLAAAVNEQIRATIAEQSAITLEEVENLRIVEFDSNHRLRGIEGALDGVRGWLLTIKEKLEELVEIKEREIARLRAENTTLRDANSAQGAELASVGAELASVKEDRDFLRRILEREIRQERDRGASLEDAIEHARRTDVAELEQLLKQDSDEEDAEYRRQEEEQAGRRSRVIR